MTRWDLDAEAVRITARQHGMAAVAQLRHAGIDRWHRGRWSAHPGWEQVTPRVLRVAGAPMTPESCWTAAVLDAGDGAVLSHTSAAALWGLPGFDTFPIHVTRPRRRARRPSTLAVVHEPLRLPESHLTSVRGVPVTTGARTIFDLAGTVRPGRAERALDNALSRNVTTLGELTRVVDELGGRGVPGTASMRRFLAARGRGYVAPESGLEARCFGWLADAGFPPLDRQVPVGDAAGLIGRVDGLCRDLPVIVEVDSHRHHSSLLDRAADARRDERLSAAGYEVVRIQEHEIDARDVRALDRLAAARARAAARRGAA